MTKRLLATLSTLVVAAMVAAACGDDTDDENTVVEIFGPFRSTEAELLAESLEPFSEATGITIRYTGTGAFVADLEEQVRTATPPDVALIPQPGLVSDLARAGALAPLDDITLEAIETNYDDEARALGQVDGQQVAVPFRATVKSLVWYRPAVFADLGLTVPPDLTALEMLVDEITAQGMTPWCLGIEAQAATGWVATDWTEDLLLRLSGPEVYDGWIDGTVPFDDPAIAEAFARFRRLGLDPGRAQGGLAGVLQTSTQDSAADLFESPATCVLHRQGSVAWGWMPDGSTFGPDGDVDFFAFPGESDGTDEPPVMIGSTSAVAFTDRPEVQALMTHLANPESTRAWAEHGGFTSPHRDADHDLPPVDRAARELLGTATVVRPDASDAMPAAIGTNLLWSEITRWVADAGSYDRFAATMDDARAALG